MYQYTTTLNKSLIALSGQYKIVIVLDSYDNMRLFLDDYVGNRQELDLTVDFFHQISNFLKNHGQLVTEEKLNYQIYYENNKLKFHIPLHLYDKIPEYIVLNQIQNDNIFTHKNKKIVNLSILKSLFEQLIEKSKNYNFYIDFENKFIELTGYNLDKYSINQSKFDITDNLFKLTNINDFNESILNLYKLHNIIDTSFINLELEFNFSNNKKEELKFYGYLATSEIIPKTNIPFDKYLIINEINEQISKFDSDLHKKHKQLIYHNYISPLIPKENFCLLEFNNFLVDNSIKFINQHTNEIEFEYIFEKEDIKSDLIETLRVLAEKLNLITEYRFKAFNNQLTIYSQFDIDVIIKTPIYIDVKTINNNNIPTFVNINSSDIKYFNDLEINDLIFEINKQEFTINKKYKINDEIYYRLNTNDENLIQYNTELKIYQKVEYDFKKLIEIQKSNFSNIYLEYIPQLNKTAYIENLKLIADNQIVLDSIDKFKNSNLIYEEPHPFLSEVIKINLGFASGTNRYNLPNVINLDKQFLIDQLNKLKFHWFLINAKPPEYLIDNNRFITNFDGTLDNVKIFSVFKKREAEYVETTFLGVTYKINQKYDGYKFAVIHLPNTNKLNDLPLYDLIINDNKKEIILVINKFLLFTDLIRNGNINNPAKLDLSFYYTVNDFHISNDSDIEFINKPAGLLITDAEIPVLFNGSANGIIDNWRKNNFICIKRNSYISNINLKLIIPNNGDFEFQYKRLDSKIGINYKFKNIQEVTDEYFWCEDLEFSFFDKTAFEINENSVDEPNFITIDESQITNPIEDSEVEIEINGNTKVIIDPRKIYSFKEDYYETTKFDINNIFKFIENTRTLNEILTEIYHNQNINSDFANEKITIFHRNQLWFLAKTLLQNNIEFPYFDYNAVRKDINQLSIDNFKNYTKHFLIGNEKLIINEPVLTEVIWDNKLTKIIRNNNLVCLYYKQTKNNSFSVFTFNDNIEKLIIPTTNTIKIPQIEFDKYYKLTEIFVNNNRIDYQIDEKNNQIKIDNQYINKTLKFIFKRK